VIDRNPTRKKRKGKKREEKKMEDDDGRVRWMGRVVEGGTANCKFPLLIFSRGGTS